MLIRIQSSYHDLNIPTNIVLKDSIVTTKFLPCTIQIFVLFKNKVKKIFFCHTGN